MKAAPVAPTGTGANSERGAGFGLTDDHWPFSPVSAPRHRPQISNTTFRKSIHLLSKQWGAHSQPRSTKCLKVWKHKSKFPSSWVQTLFLCVNRQISGGFISRSINKHKWRWLTVDLRSVSFRSNPDADGVYCSTGTPFPQNGFASFNDRVEKSCFIFCWRLLQLRSRHQCANNLSCRWTASSCVCVCVFDPIRPLPDRWPK